MEINDVDIEKRKLKRRRARLSNVSVDEVSFVDSPAINRTFLLYKRSTDETLDLNDESTMQDLTEEWESMTPEERGEIEKQMTEELSKLDSVLTLALMEQDYKKIKGSDPGLAKMLKEHPEAIDWDLSKGFSMKQEYKLKKTKYLSHDKRYFYDMEGNVWKPYRG